MGEEKDQELVKEILESDAWKMVILPIFLKRIMGHTATALEPSSPVPVVRDAQCRRVELKMLLLRIGEAAGITNYEPIK